MGPRAPITRFCLGISILLLGISQLRADDNEIHTTSQNVPISFEGGIYGQTIATMSWNTPFQDANYRAVCTASASSSDADNSQNPIQVETSTKTAATLTISIEVDLMTNPTIGVNCIGISNTYVGALHSGSVQFASDSDAPPPKQQLTWDVPFVDTNYVAACSSSVPSDGFDSEIYVYFSQKTKTGMQVGQAIQGFGSSVDCIAVEPGNSSAVSGASGIFNNSQTRNVTWNQPFANATYTAVCGVGNPTAPATGGFQAVVNSLQPTTATVTANEFPNGSADSAEVDCIATLCKVNPNMTFYQFGALSTPPQTGVPLNFGFCPLSPGQKCPTLPRPQVPPSFSWPDKGSTALCPTWKSGCALSATATMLTSFPFMQSMTPSSLDATLDGFGYGRGCISTTMVNKKCVSTSQADQCELLFCRIPEVANNAAKSANLPDVIQMVDSGPQITSWSSSSCASGLTPVQCYLQTHCCDRVVLELNEYVNGSPQPSGKHFVYVTGESAAGPPDWNVFDPGWNPTNTTPSQNLQTLSGHLCHPDGLGGFTDSTGRSRCFEVYQAETYEDSATFSRAALSTTANSPVELLLTDPQGNRLGNVQAGPDVFEIPHGSYLRNFPLADDTGTEDANGDPTGIKTVYVPEAQAGIYTLNVTGTATGSYTLEIRGVATDGSVRDTVITGVIAFGQTLVYQIIYDSTPGSSLQVTLMSVHLVTALQSLSFNASTGQYVASLTITNEGSLTANNVAVSAAELTTAETATVLPVDIGNLSHGASATINLVFPASAGAQGSTATLKVSETFSGGTAGGGFRVTLP